MRHYSNDGRNLQVKYKQTHGLRCNSFNRQHLSADAGRWRVRHIFTLWEVLLTNAFSKTVEKPHRGAGALLHVLEFRPYSSNVAGYPGDGSKRHVETLERVRYRERR
jgi:hypothetical protein